jgi:hypothetical protein
MKLPRIFLLTFLCLALSASSVFSLFQECDKIEVDVEVQDSHSAQSNGIVTINLIRGTLTNLKYIFCASENGKVLNEGTFHVNSIENLAPGEYFCIVSNNDCSKKISFTIK